MATFKFRFRFHIAHAGLIRGQEKDLKFLLPNGHDATLHCLAADSISKATKFVILSGGYSSETEALAYGTKLKEAVLCYGTIFRVGVDIGKDKSSGSFSNQIKENLFKDQGVKLIDDVHGLMAYSEESPTSAISISATGLINAKDGTSFTEEVCRILYKDIHINSQIKLAMELMAGSFFESSPRARFLTLILAAESILTPDSRSSDAIALVNQLIKTTNDSLINEAEKNSIIGTLKWLYKDSISLSLRKMANHYLPDSTYDGLSSAKFIKKCYDARSKLVHTGKVNEQKFNIGTLAANLELYMKDMLTQIANL
ncbi:MAG: hypothetical protein AAF490_27020 [Chloroflexota bacterium]